MLCVLPPFQTAALAVQKLIFILFVLLHGNCLLQAQTILHADGSPFSTRHCYTNANQELKGDPAGGVFSGCGILQQNGQWLFNPAVATSGITTFPHQCTITYTVNNQTITRSTLIYKPVQIAPALKDSATCNGAFSLRANARYAGAYRFQWTPTAPLEYPNANATAGFITQTTRFTLTTTDVSNGCAAIDTVTITRNPVPNVTLLHDNITIRSRDQVVLQANGAPYYRWLPAHWLDNPTSATPTASPQQSITYLVIGTNEQGCSDSATVTILVDDRLFVPNAFTPNNDGLNDVFRINNFGYRAVATMRIFNRWGQKVFETFDGTRGWDGTFNGRPADVGTYYYQIHLSMNDGSLNLLKGEVSLVR